jgi:uncharacterized OsmC-like protein
VTDRTLTRPINGVDVDKLFETIDAVKETPILAKFRFQARNEWLGGGHTRTTIGNFHGVTEEHSHTQTIVHDADEPPLLLGHDRGANPVEYLLTALCGCVTTAMVYHAAAKGIHLEEVESRIEGDVDLRGFLGLDKSVRPGYTGIRMTFKIKGDVPDDQLEEICHFGASRSAVFDTVTRGVPVTVEVER